MTHDMLYTTATLFAALRKGVTSEPVAAEVEADLIRSAQAGDEQAVYTLITLYAPAARNALARSGETIDREDAEMEVLASFLDLIRTHDADKSPRLAGRVSDTFRRSLTEAANAGSGNGGWSIPSRTLDRFYAILKRADGDIAEGIAIAPDFDMSAEAFAHIANLLRGTDSLDGLVSRSDEDGATDPMAGFIVGVDSGDAYAVVDDRILCESLIALVEERESDIIRYAYGFTDLPVAADEDPKAGLAKSREEGIAVANDSAIARVMGLTRPTVQRARAKALATMRAALVETTA